jgi:hypothetical protein
LRIRATVGMATRFYLPDGPVTNLVMLSQKHGDVQTLRKIADVLKISLDHLVVPEASIDTPRKRKATIR